MVKISSVNGYLAQAGRSHYCTAKFAVRGFTEALRVEMLGAGLRVGVTVVHPGGVRTNIADAAWRRRGGGIRAHRGRRAPAPDLQREDPAHAAGAGRRIVVDGVEAGRARILVGNDARLVDAFVRLFPARYAPIAVAIERRVRR